MTELFERVAEIERQLATLAQPRVRLVVEGPYDEAKQSVAALLRDEGALYPSDVAERLNLSYDVTVTILRELQQEGVVAPA